MSNNHRHKAIEAEIDVLTELEPHEFRLSVEQISDVELLEELRATIERALTMDAEGGMHNASFNTTDEERLRIVDARIEALL